MPNIRKPHASDDLLMKAVIICDDFAFAATANATLRRAGYRAGVSVRWTIKCWPANALNETTLAKQALEETLDAHLIVFPSRRAESLSSWVFSWLERWGARRHIHAAALGVISDSNAADLTKPVCPELSRFVQQHDLNLIIDGDRARDAVKLFVGFSCEREVPLPIARAGLVNFATPNSFRAYGINE